MTPPVTRARLDFQTLDNRDLPAVMLNYGAIKGAVAVNVGKVCTDIGNPKPAPKPPAPNDGKCDLFHGWNPGCDQGTGSRGGSGKYGSGKHSGKYGSGKHGSGKHGSGKHSGKYSGKYGKQGSGKQGSGKHSGKHSGKYSKACDVVAALCGVGSKPGKPGKR